MMNSAYLMVMTYISFQFNDFIKNKHNFGLFIKFILNQLHLEGGHLQVLQV